MKLKNLPSILLPREKANVNGIESLNDQELLAILLSSGYQGCNVLELSSTIIETMHGLENFDSKDLDFFLSIKGIGQHKALILMSVIELHKRIIKHKIKEYIYLENPDAIFKLYQPQFINEKQEQFLVLALNTKNALINQQVVFIGTLNHSLVHPREVINFLIQNNAAAFICLHNHPSGDVKPSLIDQEITFKLQEIGQLVGIPLIDHVIIGHQHYYSFKQNQAM